MAADNVYLDSSAALADGVVDVSTPRLVPVVHIEYLPVGTRKVVDETNPVITEFRTEYYTTTGLVPGDERVIPVGTRRYTIDVELDQIAQLADKRLAKLESATESE